MNGTTRIIVCLSVCAIVTLVAGCDEQPVVSERQERLYAAENMKLKKEIAALQEQFDKDLTVKQQELDKCIKEQNSLRGQLEANTAKVFTESVTPELMEQVQKLTSENNRLNARIEELEKQLGGGQTEPQP